MAKSNTPEISNIVNHIGNGTTITGDIETNNDIRIDGSLKGNLVTKGKLVIGETGSIKGEISCKNAVVSGKIEGKITIAELISLKASSQLHGDIVTQKIQIEPGSKFTGTCNMGSGNAVGFGEKEGQKKDK